MTQALPRQSNLVIAQAAAMPKAAFSGTTMAATVSVSQIADCASGSDSEASAKAQPRRSASSNTAIRGAKSRIVSTARHSAISSHCTSAGSVVAARNTRGRDGMVWVLVMVSPRHTAPMRRRLQIWIRLMARSSAKEIASIAMAMATAPS